LVDEATDVRFEIARQILVLEQDVDFGRLMPAPDLAPGLLTVREFNKSRHLTMDNRRTIGPYVLLT
jgi:hypothetical protein